MGRVGIRDLTQNASRVVARAVEGEQITITDRGRPVAQLSAIRQSPIADLVASGDARQPLRPLAELAPPLVAAEASSALARMRDEDRY